MLKQYFFYTYYVRPVRDSSLEGDRYGPTGSPLRTFTSGMPVLCLRCVAFPPQFIVGYRQFLSVLAFFPIVRPNTNTIPPQEPIKTMRYCCGFSSRAIRVEN